MPPTTSALREALDRLLGTIDIEEFVTSRRSAGDSWRRISVALYDATGVEVAYETLRAWFPDEVRA